MTKHDDGGPFKDASYHQWLVGILANGSMVRGECATGFEDRWAASIFKHADAIIAEQRRRERG